MMIKLKNKENTIKLYVHDVRNFIVEVTRINSKGKKETNKHYYSSLESALKYILDDFAFISEDKTITDFKLYLDAMKAQLWKELEQLEFPTNKEILAKQKTEKDEFAEDFSDDTDFADDEEDFADDEDDDWT